MRVSIIAHGQPHQYARVVLRGLLPDGLPAAPAALAPQFLADLQDALDQLRETASTLAEAGSNE